MTTPKIFVSYAAPDRALAGELLRRLRRLPVEVWSHEQISVGDNWADILRAKLRDSEYFVILLTPLALDSSWVLQELGAAWALGKHIIPVVTDRRLLDKLPVNLTNIVAFTVDEMDKIEDVIQSAA